MRLESIYTSSEEETRKSNLETQPWSLTRALSVICELGQLSTNMFSYARTCSDSEALAEHAEAENEFHTPFALLLNLIGLYGDSG